MIHTDFDPEKTAVIEPSEFYHPMENMPEALIGVFSRPLTEKYAAEFHGEVIMQYQDCNGGEPVYRCTAPNGTAFALMCMRVGAPSACGIMEEMIPHGVKKFLMLGSCGALDHAITAGHILVPYAAVRDEGTSYHYAPPAEEAVLESACVDAVCQALEDMDVPYARVKTWTTDAFFRETRASAVPAWRAAPAAERRAKRKRAVLRQTKACLRAHPTGAQSPLRAMIMQNT